MARFFADQSRTARDHTKDIPSTRQTLACGILQQRPFCYHHDASRFMTELPQEKPRKQRALCFKTGEDIRDYRKRHAMNQSEFWSRVGVTQSGGSRYESGRNIPRPVQILLHLTYGKDKQATDMLARLRSHCNR